MLFFTKLKFHNIGIWGDKELNMGKINIARGRIDTGKTTIIDGAILLITGGHFPELIKGFPDNPAIDSYIRGDLSNGMYIVKNLRLSAEDSTVEIFDANGQKVTKNAPTFLNQIRNINSVNAGSFANAKNDADRISRLVAILNIQLDRARLSSISGDIIFKEANNPLDTIKNARKAIFEKRTGENGRYDENMAAANRIIETLPPELNGVSYDEQLADIRLKKSNIEKRSAIASETARSKRDAIKNEIDVKCKAAESELKITQKQELEALNNTHKTTTNAIQEEISRLTAQLTTLNQKNEADNISMQNMHTEALRSITTPFNAEIKAADDECTDELDRIKSEEEKESTPLVSEIASLEQQSANILVVKRQRSIASDFEAVAAKHKADSDILTGKLESIDAMLEEMANGIKEKIPGLDIRESKIYLECPIGSGEYYSFEDQVNESRKIDFYIQLAKHGAGELGTIAMDGLEAFDTTNFDKFIERLKMTDPQFIFSRVEDVDFTFDVINY